MRRLEAIGLYRHLGALENKTKTTHIVRKFCNGIQIWWFQDNQLALRVHGARKCSYTVNYTALSSILTRAYHWGIGATNLIFMTQSISLFWVWNCESVIKVMMMGAVPHATDSCNWRTKSLLCCWSLRCYFEDICSFSLYDQKLGDTFPMRHNVKWPNLIPKINCPSLYGAILIVALRAEVGRTSIRLRPAVSIYKIM
jgi:hypothetical protein